VTPNPLDFAAKEMSSYRRLPLCRASGPCNYGGAVADGLRERWSLSSSKRPRNIAESPDSYDFLLGVELEAFATLKVGVAVEGIVTAGEGDMAISVGDGDVDADHADFEAMLEFLALFREGLRRGHRERELQKSVARLSLSPFHADHDVKIQDSSRGGDGGESAL
jgi:hypothetical protein